MFIFIYNKINRLNIPVLSDSFAAMIFLRKHIAGILALVFAFPILMQSVHIVLHHAREAEEDHICLHSEESHNENDHATFDSSAERCLICHYVFTTFSPAKIDHFNFTRPLHFGLINTPAILQPEIAISKGVSLRAPPATS
ncbi:hypothetical protein [Sunxiuqinia indica]|uniref:hypothetical protein n=1 Tax=Sunxiuqinia indica TaxID=2692584 RepID=UPI001357FE82|nr:hypothetical protein [Sunxiuqinia indica]